MEVFLAWSYEYMKNKEAEGVVGFNGRKRRKAKLLKDHQPISLFFVFFRFSGKLKVVEIGMLT